MNITTSNMDQLNKRVVGIDVYRIIACFLVIVVHCNSKVMVQLQPQSLAWYVSIAVFYVTKVAVTGFFMIMGYNLLHKEDGMAKYWQRVGRMGVILVLFSILYFAWKVNAGTLVAEGTGIWPYVKLCVEMIVARPVTDSFWYLYAYLGIILVLPLLQKLVSRMDDSEYQLFFVLGILFVSIIPLIGEFVPALRITTEFELPVVCSSVLYMMIGHYFYISNGFVDELVGGTSRIANKRIQNRISDSRGIRPWVLVSGWIVGFAINMVISIAEAHATGGEHFLSAGDNAYFGVLLQSVCFFALVLRWDVPSWLAKVVAVVAPTTFGIYLLNDFLCTETTILYVNLCPYMNRLLAVAIEEVVAFVIGFAVVWLLRLIPIVRKYL